MDEDVQIALQRMEEYLADPAGTSFEEWDKEIMKDWRVRFWSAVYHPWYKFELFLLKRNHQRFVNWVHRND